MDEQREVLGAGPHMDWTAVSELGVVAGIAVFLVWTSWVREQRLAARITRLEEFVEKKLLDTITASIDALNANTEALVNLTQALANRPCLTNAELMDTRDDIP